MDLCQQSNVSAFYYAVVVGHSFSSKEQASFNFMAADNICGDFGAPKYKVSRCFHCFPIYLPWSDGTRSHDLCFLNVEFKPAFSLSTFTFIKRLFSSSLLSAIRWCHLHMWGYWYSSLRSWFQLVLYPAWHFAWCSLHISCTTMKNSPGSSQIEKAHTQQWRPSATKNKY